MADETRPTGNVNRATLPTATSDGDRAFARASRYGEQVVQPIGGDRYPLVDESSYYIATNPTPGTAIAGIIAANGYDDTEALLYLENTHATKHIYLDYLHLICKVAGVNGTDFGYAIDVATTATYASGGSAITPVCTNREGELENKAPVIMYFGAVVTTTGTTEKIMSHGQLLTTIKVIGDHYLLAFGGKPLAPATQIMEGTAQRSVQKSCPPIIVPPGYGLSFRDFATSQSGAAQYQFELGFWVR